VTDVSTHILDTASGRPAAGIEVELQAATAGGQWRRLAAATTDEDGRARGLAGPSGAEPGVHRLVFHTAPYLSAAHAGAFFPEVIVTFEIAAEDRLHVPLLLSPFGYSVYRGS
jgi:hydroxyisourate hydrolase